MKPTEAQCQTTIIQAARQLGFLVHHARAARRQSGHYSTPLQGDRGFPDLVIAGHGRVIVAELKRKPNTVSAEQMDWLTRLDRGGINSVVVWVPEQQDDFIAYLQEVAGR